MTRQSYSAKEIDLALECKDMSEFLRRHEELQLCPARSAVSLYAIWNAKSTYRKMREKAATDAANHTITIKNKAPMTPASGSQKSLEEYAVDHINLLMEQTSILNEILTVQKAQLKLFEAIRLDKTFKPTTTATGATTPYVEVASAPTKTF